MTLYEIDSAIMDCVDEETGEILNYDRLSELNIERDKKIESVALWVKNLDAELDGVKKEKSNFMVRQKSLERKIENLQKYLCDATNFSDFKTDKCEIKFRKSASVNITDLDMLDDEYVVEKVERVANKNLIKEDIKLGAIINGAELIEKLNIKVR